MQGQWEQQIKTEGSVGLKDDTNKYGTTHERPKRVAWDDQRFLSRAVLCWYLARDKRRQCLPLWPEPVHSNRSIAQRSWASCIDHHGVDSANQAAPRGTYLTVKLISLTNGAVSETGWPDWHDLLLLRLSNAG